MHDCRQCMSLLQATRFPVLVQVVVERLAEFLHKFGAEGEAWEPLRKFVKDLGVLVTAIRFNRWPELLPPLLCCLMAGIERDYADDGGGDQPADVSVLHLLLADSVDVPRALRLYIETGEPCPCHSL